MNMPINYLSVDTSETTAATGPSPSYPGDDSLLAALAFVRDHIDADNQRQCVEALEHALCAAVKLERTLLNQTRHIEEMARMASTDHLTGTYNRRGFEQEFQRALAAATRYDETGVLVFIDLDGFKPINDTYGHATGDLVLREVSHVLQQNVRPQDLVARVGGDEFVVLLTRTDWENGLERAEFLKRLLNTTYVRWSGKNIAVRASFGFQRFGANGDAEQLLRSADNAMYEAKRLRGGARNAEL